MKTQIIILLVVLASVIGSALGVVNMRHQGRLLAIELSELETEQDEGLAEWSRLQIEQGWLADASRIEKTARGVLRMQQPPTTQILVIEP